MKASLWTALAVLALCVQFGCGGKAEGPETRTVSGTITLDGDPIADGDIVFRAADGSDRSYGGPIQNGKYSFPSSLGAKTVEISAMGVIEGAQAVSGTPGDPVSEENPAEALKELVPERYNAKTTLTADVTADGDNQFDFELTTR